MPAAIQNPPPAATLAPPIQLASSGFPAISANGLSRSATSVGTGHSLRRERNQQPVHARVSLHDFERLGKAFRRCIADNVDRVVTAPVGGKTHPDSIVSARVPPIRRLPRSAHRSRAPRPPGVRNIRDGDHLGAAVWPDFGHIEQIADPLHAQDPASPSAASKTSSLPVSAPV